MDFDLVLEPDYESDIEDRRMKMPCNLVERVYNKNAYPIQNISDTICAENYGDNYFCGDALPDLDRDRKQELKKNRCLFKGEYGNDRVEPVLPDPVKKPSAGMIDRVKFDAIVTVLKRDMVYPSLNIKRLSIYDHESIRILLQDIELLIHKIPTGYIENETHVHPGAVGNIDLTVTYLKEIKSTIQQNLEAIEGAHDAENNYDFFKRILGISYLEYTFDIVMSAVIYNAAKIYVYGKSFLEGKPPVFQKNRHRLGYRKNDAPLHLRSSINKNKPKKTGDVSQYTSTNMRRGSKKRKKTKRRKYKRKSKRKYNKRKTKKNI